MAKRIVEIVLKVTGNEQLAKMAGNVKKVSGLSVDAAKKLAAVAAAITAMVVASSKAQKELALLARQAKLSVQEFQALAFATSQYGLNAEQIADISKDLSDRLGEFATVGTGTFQDFADVVGLTKDEAMDMAEELQTLSSDQVIGKLVNEMEAVNASGGQMTFVLESMGNDLSRLIPLFTDGSKELKSLTSTFNEATKSFELSSTQLRALNEAGVAFDLTTASLKGAATSISSTIAPLVTGFFSDFIEIVPEATKAINEFIASFLDADQLNSIALIDAEVRSLSVTIAEEQAKIDKIRAEGRQFDGGRTGGRKRLEQARARQKEEIDRLTALQTRRKELTDEQARIEQTAADATAAQNAATANRTIEELQKSFDIELLLYQQKEDLKTQVLNGQISEREAASQLEELSALAQLEREIKALEVLEAQGGDAAKLIADIEAKKTLIMDTESAKRKAIAADEAAKTTQAHIKGAASFITGLAQVNEKSKGLKRASIVANTAVAVMETLAVGGFWAIPLAAITAAIGVQQFAAVGKSSGVAGVGGGGGGAPVQTPSAGINSPSVTTETQVNQVNSTELTALRNELSLLDPDEVLPVSFTRRLSLSLNNANAQGLI